MVFMEQLIRELCIRMEEVRPVIF